MSGEPPVSQPPEPLEPSGPPQPLGRRPESEGEVFWSWADLLLFVGLAIPSMLIGMALVKGILWLFHIHPGFRAAVLVPEQFAGYALMFAALLAIFRIQYGRPFWRSLAWVNPRIPPVWIGLAGIATAILVAFASTLIRTPNTTNPMMELLQNRASVILVAAFGVTLAPICEELAFRGFLQPLLVRALGPVAGILAAAVPFGLLHYSEYGNSWRHVVVISLAGAAFGWMRHATGSTKASAIMHACYNAFFFAALLGGAGTVPHR